MSANPETLAGVRRYLFNGRKQLITRPKEEDVQRVVSYRSSVCYAHHEATEAEAPADVLEYLRVEYWWAVDVMLANGITPPGMEPQTEEAETMTKVDEQVRDPFARALMNELNDSLKEPDEEPNEADQADEFPAGNERQEPAHMQEHGFQRDETVTAAAAPPAEETPSAPKPYEEPKGEPKRWSKPELVAWLKSARPDLFVDFPPPKWRKAQLVEAVGFAKENPGTALTVTVEAGLVTAHLATDVAAPIAEDEPTTPSGLKPRPVDQNEEQAIVAPLADSRFKVTQVVDMRGYETGVYDLYIDCLPMDREPIHLHHAIGHILDRISGKDDEAGHWALIPYNKGSWMADVLLARDIHNLTGPIFLSSRDPLASALLPTLLKHARNKTKGV